MRMGENRRLWEAVEVGILVGRGVGEAQPGEKEDTQQGPEMQ
jgi:hypothetical protein